MGTRRPTSQLATTTNSTMADVPVSHMLHSGYANPTLRAWQATDTTVGPDNLMYPLFIVDDPDAEQSIGAMPGVSRFGVNRLEGHLVPLVANGLSSVLLFGVPFDVPMDQRHQSSSLLRRSRNFSPILLSPATFASVLTLITATVEFFVRTEH